MTKTIRALITGRVQGVGYRAWTVSTAKKMRLDGWVRNRSDGSVEAVFSGNAVQVDLMVEECKKGPPFSRVDKIELYTHTHSEPDGFSAKPTL